MKKVISNRLNMYGSVRSTLNSNQAAWNDVPAFAETVLEFTQKLSDLNAALIRSESIKDGVKASRDAKVDEVRVLTTRFVKAFQVLALVNNHLALKDHYGFPASLIGKMTLAQLQVFLSGMIADVNSNAAGLTAYSLTAADVERLTAMEAGFPDLISMVRDAVIDRSGSNKSILELDHALQVILHDKLDKMLVILGDEHPEFLSAYRKARHVIDHPKSRGDDEPPQTDQAA